MVNDWFTLTSGGRQSERSNMVKAPGGHSPSQRKEPWPRPSQGSLRSSWWNERLQATNGENVAAPSS
jgi:hypothetical protein